MNPMQIIQHNPYRTLGLLIGATASEQKRQHTRLQRFLEAELEPEVDFSFSILGVFERTVESVNDASSKLNLDSDKMNAAMFWFYNGNSVTDEPAFEAMKSGDINDALSIWTNLTTNGGISKRSASAYNNLGTLYLSGVLKDTHETQIEQGVHFKLKFLESDYIDDIKALATDETFQITKRDIQLLFLNHLQTCIKEKGVISLDKFLDIINSQNFIAKEDYLKSFAQELIEEIERSVEELKIKRKTDKSNAVEFGETLYKRTFEKLQQVKSTLGDSDISYTSIADKLANEILQCSIEFFNYNQKINSVVDYITPTLKLVNLSKNIAVGELIKDRIQDNLNTIEETKIHSLCFFCNKNIAVDDSSAYKDTIYKETYRSPRYLPSRQVKFQKLEVTTPRCKQCQQIHESSKGWLTRLPIILFAVIGLVLGLTLWGNWFLFLILGGLFGAFIGFIISSIDQSIKTETSNIKGESSFNEFKPIKKLLSVGWTIYEPTP